METVPGASRFDKFMYFVGERSKVMERLKTIDVVMEGKLENCGNCSKPGHSEGSCWRKKKVNPAGGNPACEYCGQPGHDADSCYKKDRDEG